MAQAPIVEYGVRNALAAHRLALHRSRFRSSFRDWEGNETHFPREIAEHALAHVIGDKAEQAYRRGDALDKRRKLMAAWASFLEPKPVAIEPKRAANVVPLPKVPA